MVHWSFQLSRGARAVWNSTTKWTHFAHRWRNWVPTSKFKLWRLFYKLFILDCFTVPYGMPYAGSMAVPHRRNRLIFILIMMTSSNHFPRYWSFVRGIHRSPVISPNKGHWREALMFSLIWAWIMDGWVNNREVVDLRRHRAHCDVIAM